MYMVQLDLTYVLFELNYFEFPLILNSKPFGLLNLPFDHLVIYYQLFSAPTV